MYLRSDERGPPMRGNSRRCGSRSSAASRWSSSSILFFRLWFLQVINGSSTWPRRTATAPASSGSAPRAGRSSTATATCWSPTGPASPSSPTRRSCREDPAELRQRAGAGREPHPHHADAAAADDARRAKNWRPGAPVTLRSDVGRYLLYYVEENKGKFPGIDVQTVFVRRYPDGTLAAHVLGYVGEIEEDQLKEPRYRGLEPGDQIGQEGVEYTYDRYLRGEPGMTRIQVDAFGQPTAGRQAGLAAPGARRQPEADDRRRRPGRGRRGAAGRRACTAPSSR